MFTIRPVLSFFTESSLVIRRILSKITPLTHTRFVTVQQQQQQSKSIFVREIWHNYSRLTPVIIYFFCSYNNQKNGRSWLFSISFYGFFWLSFRRRYNGPRTNQFLPERIQWRRYSSWPRFGSAPDQVGIGFVQGRE